MNLSYTIDQLDDDYPIEAWRGQYHFTLTDDDGVIIDSHGGYPTYAAAEFVAIDQQNTFAEEWPENC